MAGRPAPGGAPRPGGEARAATAAPGTGGGAQSPLGQDGVPPRATGAGASRRSGTVGPPSCSAARPAASGLRSPRAGRPAEARGATPPGRATDTLSVLFTLGHRLGPPSGPQGRRARRGEPLCPRRLLGLFLPQRASFPHPFPLQSPVLSLEVGKGVSRVRRLLFGCLSRPQTLNIRDARPDRDIWGQREGASRAFQALSLPPGPPAPLPRPAGPGSPARAAAPGSGRVKPWNVAARNVHADESGEGRGGGADPGGAHANRMQMRRPVAAAAAAPPSFPDPSPDGGGSGSLGAETLGGHRGTGRRRRKRRRQRRRPRGGGGGFDLRLRRRHGGLIPGGFLD